MGEKTVNPNNNNPNHSNYQRGSNIPTQPSVPKMPPVKSPAKTPSKK